MVLGSTAENGGTGREDGGEKVEVGGTDRVSKRWRWENSFTMYLQ